MCGTDYFAIVETHLQKESTLPALDENTARGDSRRPYDAPADNVSSRNPRASLPQPQEDSTDARTHTDQNNSARKLRRLMNSRHFPGTEPVPASDQGLRNCPSDNDNGDHDRRSTTPAQALHAEAPPSASQFPPDATAALQAELAASRAARAHTNRLLEMLLYETQQNQHLLYALHDRLHHVVDARARAQLGAAAALHLPTAAVSAGGGTSARDTSPQLKNEGAARLKELGSEWEMMCERWR